MDIEDNFSILPIPLQGIHKYFLIIRVKMGIEFLENTPEPDTQSWYMFFTTIAQFVSETLPSAKFKE